MVIMQFAGHTTNHVTNQNLNQPAHEANCNHRDMIIATMKIVQLPVNTSC
jgi:hypothetical protein